MKKKERKTGGAGFAAIQFTSLLPMLQLSLQHGSSPGR